MSVDIEPSELGFRRPFTAEVAQILKIRNPNKSPVAFKVKTTAPKQYCVRPNSGRIEPDHDVEVTVLLQAMKQDPPLDFKCRDKFLVQSVPITGDKEFVGVQEIWDSVAKSDIQERKIRVTFLPGEEGATSGASAATPIRHNLANGVEATPDAPPPAYSSPREDDTMISTAAGHGEESPDTKHDTKSEAEDARSMASATNITAAKDTVVEVLKEKLAQAEAMIASLKAEAASGLRQRKGAAGAAANEVSAAGAQLQEAVRQGTEGVPVQVAAILCLISFLLAYFFF